MAVVDRFFPIAWIGLYLLLPVSGWAAVMFTSWHDQERFVATLRSILENGHAADIRDNVIGPAYITAAAAVHYTFGLSPEDSLVALNRASYALTVAGSLLLVRTLLRGLTDVPALVSLAAQFCLVAVAFAAGTWHWSDVPWSHFFAAFLAVAFYAARFVPARLTGVAAAATGAMLALLSLTRSFEFAAVMAGWVVALVLLAVLRPARGWRLPRAPQLAAGAVAFLVTASAVYLATGKRDVFFLYGGQLDSQSGYVGASAIAQTPPFSLSLIPYKLVQLFVEPCFYAICRFSDYTGDVAGLSAQAQGNAGNYRLWRLPLAVQLPSLVLLPICLVVVGALVVRAARAPRVLDRNARALRLLIELTVAATVLVLGYAATTLSGSPQLRYGFARDFLLPAALTTIALVALVSAGLWLLLTRYLRTRLLSPETAFVLAAVIGSSCLVAGVAVGRVHGLPRIEGHQLGAVTYAARCRDDRCDVAIRATTTSGRATSIPRASTLTFGCGSAHPRFTIYARDPTRGVRITQPCPAPRLVAAWPTVMGLPPGTFELNAVTVRNA